MPSQQQLQRNLQGIMRALEQTLQELHGERIGCTLLVFELNRDEGTNIAYVSNAQTDGMIKSMKECVARLEVEVETTHGPVGKLGRS